jgi:anti-sigma factor RsiW
MTTSSEHVTESLGAYLFGALEEREVRAVDDHLATCAECRAQLDTLTELHGALGTVPPEALLEGPPDDGDLLLRRTLRRVREEKRASQFSRRAMVGAAAVVAVAIALGGGVLLGRGTGPSQQAALPPPPVSATTPSLVPGTKVASAVQDGVRLNVTVTPAAGWVQLNASVTGIPAGQRCRLVVVSKSGQVEVAGSWLVSPKLAANGTNLDGDALVAPADVASVQVQNFDGHTFVVAHL